MDPKAEDDFHRAMFQDLPANPNPPKALAHYTSLATLELIVKSGELWLSNPLYMNDLEELRFGMHTGATVFRANETLKKSCGDTEAHTFLISAFDTLFAEFDSNHALDVYVFCLAEHEQNNSDGILSMWRGYGAQGGGAAFVIDPSKASFVIPLPLITDKVVYANQFERVTWLNDKVEVLAGVIARHEKTQPNLYAAAHYWFERLKLFALFTKHPGFSEEREWRVVYAKQRDQTEQFSDLLGYTVTDKGVQPKLKLKVDRLMIPDANLSPIETLISQVILGPTISSPLARASVQRMFSLVGQQSLAERVVASSIPFRS